MKIDVLPTHDEAGDVLFSALRTVAEGTVPGAVVRRVDSSSPTAILKSSMSADVTIVDLTPGEDGSHRYTAMSYPWLQDNVLVVARSYMPVNVLPLHRGGGPVYPGRKSVEEIVSWVREQLRRPEIVERRRSLFARTVGSFVGGVGATTSRADPWTDVDAFLSYRGCDLEETRRLRESLERGEFHDGVPQKVLMFEAGELTHPNAVLPPVMRWNVLSIISDIVNSCEQMWVLGGDHYLESWWTQGELICRHYFGGSPCTSTHPRCAAS